MYNLNIVLDQDFWIHKNIKARNSRGVFRKKCSENMQQIYRRTPVLKCDFKLQINIAWTPPLAVHSRHVVTKPLWWWGHIYICIYMCTKSHNSFVFQEFILGSFLWKSSRFSISNWKYTPFYIYKTGKMTLNWVF